MSRAAAVYIKKGDNVEVIRGDDKAKRGRVLRIISKSNKIVVEGVNRVYKHVKPNRRNPQGGPSVEGDAHRRFQRHAHRSGDKQADSSWRALSARWLQGAVRQEERHGPAEDVEAAPGLCQDDGLSLGITSATRRGRDPRRAPPHPRCQPGIFADFRADSARENSFKGSRKRVSSAGVPTPAAGSLTCSPIRRTPTSVIGFEVDLDGQAGRSDSSVRQKL